MAKNNNVNKEIQELIQKIKNEYQERVDFKFSSGENGLKNHGVAFIVIISPHLKKFFRERFNFPLGVVNHLDYVKMDQEGGDLLYRIHNHYENDSLSSADGRVWPEKEKGENCQVCGGLTFKKNGRMELWNGEKINNKPDPKVIAYLHPECAKKYFANKEQPNQNNNSQIKEKLLRNLDKLCLDPNGYLANNEHLKTDGAEEEYQKIFASDNWKKRYLKIVVDGEEIDLEDWDNSCPEYWEVKRELIKKIKQEIQQNPSEWKIEKGKEENYADESNNRLIKHVSGRRHWKYAISYLWGGDSSERIKHWTEIEALINGSAVPKFNDNDKNNQISESEKEQIRQYFQENDIKEIKFENGKLIITHNNNNNNNNETKTFRQISHDPKLLEITEYCQKVNGNKITQESLNPSSDNSSTNPKPSQWENKYLWLAGGILLGIIISVILVSYYRRKRKIK